MHWNATVKSTSWNIEKVNNFNWHSRSLLRTSFSEHLLDTLVIISSRTKQHEKKNIEMKKKNSNNNGKIVSWDAMTTILK